MPKSLTLIYEAFEFEQCERSACAQAALILAAEWRLFNSLSSQQFDDLALLLKA